tara:strand:- start:2643 stop:2858 length:216 start_codon:yes stop_codon:yes gene_type:complete
VHEIASEIAIGQAESAKQASRKPMRRQVGKAESGADDLPPEIEGDGRDEAGDEHHSQGLGEPGWQDGGAIG